MLNDKKYVSRGGLKLEHALKEFGVDVTGMTVLDVGSSTGGFVDCLLQNGAAKVFSVDTAYGELAWKLRKNPRVVVIERQNILHMETLPESVGLVTIDVTFTSLVKILPIIRKFLKPDGKIIALLKPQYEDQKLALKNKGVIPIDKLEEISDNIRFKIDEIGFKILKESYSPILGTGGNKEYLIYIDSGSSPE